MEKKMRLRKIKQQMIYNTGAVLMPTKAVFYPTMRCNLKCGMCFQKKHIRELEELKLDEITRVFEGIKLSSIVLVGGEIFLRKDIYEILDYFNSTVEHVIIQTNATLIGDEGIDKLLSLNHIDEVMISIDGTKEIHDSLRGNGTFVKAIDVIRKLRGKKKIIVNTVIMRENIEDLMNLYDFLNCEGVDNIIYQFQMIYSMEDYKNTTELLMEKNVLYDMHDDCVVERVELFSVKKISEVIEELEKNIGETKISYSPDIFKSNIEQYVKGTIRDSSTLVCRDMVNAVLKVDPQGDVMVCEALKCTLGNLREQQLSEMWNADNAKKIRKALCKNNLCELCCRCCCLEKLDME